MVCVPNAKVPIVKIWDPELSLACDMNVNNTLALENTRMIKTYVEIDARVRPLAMIIKHWTKRRILNDAGRWCSCYPSRARVADLGISPGWDVELLYVDLHDPEFSANEEPAGSAVPAPEATFAITRRGGKAVRVRRRPRGAPWFRRNEQGDVG